MRVVVTGATGAIGHALIAECIRQDIEVAAICHKNSVRAERLADEVARFMYIEDEFSGNSPEDEKQMKEHVSEKLHIYFLNLDEYAASAENGLTGIEGLMEPVKNGSGYDLFFHLAWNGTTGAARNDKSLQQNNVRYAMDAVRLSYKLRCHTFIGAGSQAEYGRTEGKLGADTPTHPDNEYGRGKLMAGIQTRKLCRELSIKHIWLRILSVYGPYDTTTSMVMAAIDTLKKGECPQFTKGEQQWDYLYSKDAAKALLAAGMYGRDGMIYPIGSGKTRRLAEYIDILKNQVDPKGHVSMGAIPYAPCQVMYLCADISKLTEDTGFVPETEFAEGIQKILEVERSRI